MIDNPKTDEAIPTDEAVEMEKVQKDAAEEREANGGYQ